jgi:hypothetical protein
MNKYKLLKDWDCIDANLPYFGMHLEGSEIEVHQDHAAPLLNTGVIAPIVDGVVVEGNIDPEQQRRKELADQAMRETESMEKEADMKELEEGVKEVEEAVEEVPETVEEPSGEETVAPVEEEKKW